MSTPAASIGVLDSGIGGLSVLRAIHQRLPTHPTLYFADQAHLPYGPRDPRQVRGYVRAIAKFLIAEGAAVVVVACNAASAASLLDLRQEFPQVPFVGMEPAVKPAVAATKTGVVGVLTTQATAEGPLYRRVVARYADGVRVITQVAPELVTIAERNSQHSAQSLATIARAIEPLLAANCDQIALACTHFPFLKAAISVAAGPGVALIDPSAAIARQTARVWPDSVTGTPAENRYFTSDDATVMGARLKELIGVEAGVERAHASHS